jgi:hypothetical protein
MFLDIRYHTCKFITLVLVMYWSNAPSPRRILAPQPGLSTEPIASSSTTTASTRSFPVFSSGTCLTGDSECMAQLCSSCVTVQSHTSYMASKRTVSKMALKPRAPVLLAIAFLANNLSAPSVKCSLTCLTKRCNIRSEIDWYKKICYNNKFVWAHFVQVKHFPVLFGK